MKLIIRIFFVLKTRRYCIQHEIQNKTFLSLIKSDGRPKLTRNFICMINSSKSRDLSYRCCAFNFVEKFVIEEWRNGKVEHGGCYFFFQKEMFVKYI